MSLERVLIKIHGIVQGVGFRPFIHKLVRYYKLTGYIKNTSSGVELELEGERPELQRFVADVPVKAPKLALIEKVEAEYGLEPTGFEGFEIRKSKTEETRNTLISPDICICEDCLREMLDPKDRRYRYPFINCTNCGPRFTIIKDVPYDRIKTSMSDFPMCPDCDREYHDIENRRYHAQPDACHICGPECSFVLPGGETTAVRDDAVEEARRQLKSNRIIAVKGLGGMHLACSLQMADELRRRKHRDEKPFAIMCRDVECARKICKVSAEEEKLLTGFRRPIVLLEKKDKNSLKNISENGCVGVMLPYTPLHYLLFGDDIDMLIMTSANLSETPIMFKNSEAMEKLSGIADGFLLHNREIQTRCDDSLCYEYEGKEYFFRRSRGYVPFPIKLNIEPLTPKLAPVLACGAEQKASFCLCKDDYVFPCQHIGDLKNIETYEHYCNQIEHFKRLFDFKPEAVACDLHPDYLSTRYAAETGLPVIQIQHHHAHMASCMADNNLSGEAIGLIWDGTGLGTDNTIWGAECLIGGYEGFERFGSIRKIPLIGGDRVTEELDRVAFALLEESGIEADVENSETFRMMLKSGLNCPEASSLGRLFDGAAAICGIKHIASYEGQGAVLLEAAAGSSEDVYPVEFDGHDFDWRPMLRALAEDKNAAKFMNTLIEAAVRQCIMAKEATGLDRVVLSGGTFQNMYIMKRLPARLKAAGFNVYHHERVSCNDEGLSLGQTVIANCRIKSGRI